MYTDVQGEELEDTQPKGYLNFETETADDETDEDTGDVAEPTQVETVATKGLRSLGQRTSSAADHLLLGG
jgi:hypothetical protein